MITNRYAFGATYNIDKCEFLEIWHAARDIAITLANIQSAWTKCGIVREEDGSLYREKVLSQLPDPPIALSSCPSTSGGPINL
jgi:hypothetical protein